MDDIVRGLVVPRWPEIAGVHACMTTRLAGCLAGGHGEFDLMNWPNLGAAAGEENSGNVLVQDLGLPRAPVLPVQVHGSEVVHAETMTAAVRADAVVSFSRGFVCAVLTADCLPVVFSNLDGTKTAVAHVGWRGLAAGVLPATLAALGCLGAQLQVWCAACIGLHAFEVGDSVREILLAKNSCWASCFFPNGTGSWHADLRRMAILQLNELQISRVYSSRHCTFRDEKWFYSHRRDGDKAGRMMTLVWT